MLPLPYVRITVDLMLPVGVGGGKLCGTCLIQVLCWQPLISKLEHVYIVRLIKPEVTVYMPA